MRTITLPERDFEHLLACLANQKFIHDVNADGISMGIKKVRSIQQENQACIDKAYHKEMKRLINNRPKQSDKIEYAKNYSRRRQS